MERNIIKTDEVRFKDIGQPFYIFCKKDLASQDLLRGRVASPQKVLAETHPITLHISSISDWLANLPSLCKGFRLGSTSRAFSSSAVLATYT